MTEIEQPPQNGIDPTAGDDDENSKARPADIEQDMREMERRKRVEAIMGSRLFREELERIVDSAREGGAGASGILQQLSDIVGVPVNRVGSVFKSTNCMVPINDIRGVESMGYAKGEKILRCKLAATFRLLDLYGWTQGLGAQITARLKVDQEYFLVNPYGLLYHEITASSLNKVDMQGQIVEQGTTNFGVNKSHFGIHSVVHAARPDIRCAIYIGCSPVVAISSLKSGLLPLTKDACVLGEITTHAYTGLFDEEERNRLVRNLGPNSKVILLANHGALCCGETIEEAFFAACHIVQACETQLKLLPVGVDNLVLIPEESRKVIYEQSRRPPEDLEKKFAAVVSAEDGGAAASKDDATPKVGSPPKWRVGGAEFEALMRMLDNAGYRTGYIYRHPLIKSDPPKPKNDVELPPAVSSLGYLLEEEELFRQGIWKKGDIRKGGDRSRWLNSPNVYQKVEVLETGTPDPKKITKWVAEGSPTHSTPVRIEDPLQFVPAGTTTKEFKRVQQQIKDNRRADKISAGPQSHILEGVTWDEANRIKDATVSQAGDHVVLMGAASKGIIQRGFQHNATVYKAPYAKNPFDNVTDDELNEYKRTVERKKKSIHGEYTDTDFSESEALNSMQAAGALAHAKHAQSEPETEHQVIQIQTQQAPIPSQAEVVLSDEISLSLLDKYAFLYDSRNYLNTCSEVYQNREEQIYVIYKVETTSQHNYPPINETHTTMNYSSSFAAAAPSTTSTPTRPNEATSSSLSSSSEMPFRTLSHYGFNCPSTTEPSILLHPAQQSIWLSVAEQREKVVSFIDLNAMSLEKRKLLETLSITKSTIAAETLPPSSPSYVSQMHIELTPPTPKHKHRIYSSIANTSTSSGGEGRSSLNDSIDALADIFATGFNLHTPQRAAEAAASRSFLPDNHALPTDSQAREQPEADMMEDSGINTTINTAGGGTRRQRRVTSSNDSSVLSTSSIELLINITLRNSDCAQAIEQDFRAKLEKVIDEEINNIAQQLANQQQHRFELTREPLGTPTPTLFQRCNSSPALCHTYSYVNLPQAPAPSPAAIVHTELDDLQQFLSSLDQKLQKLLASIMEAYGLHHKAIIDCRSSISKLADDLATGKLRLGI
ncbi:protein hu-li tai shao isoform X1 [Drosophila willistoni]|uniref:protein hu-li tai shao isoform X1 n=1 Tax=Drosophila willistoni TaxID=7260 RepID=UPI000C26D6AA|nr:protein hu-li tai shao isoform X1 [Drosophila willistoni]